MHVNTIYKAPKGIIRISAEVNDNKMSNVRITGDFFMVPEDSILTLEKYLEGTKLEYTSVSDAVNKFYLSGVMTPMVTKLDLVTAIMGVVVGERKTN
jgi:hypothetical protein